MQDVVRALVTVDALDCSHVPWLGNHADHALVATPIGANLTELALGDVLAAGAKAGEPDFSPQIRSILRLFREKAPPDAIIWRRSSKDPGRVKGGLPPGRFASDAPATLSKATARGYIGDLDPFWEIQMRIVLAAAGLIALSVPALAQGRPATPNMTCAQASNLVARQQAIVLTTGRGAGGDLYDRYVSSGGFCPAGLYGRVAFVPTRDKPNCNIGYYCTSARPDFSRD